jgi:hypothetical protein
MSLQTIPASAFVSPTPRAELAGALGLSLHEVAQSLGIQFRDAKKKLEDRGMLERCRSQGFQAVAIATQLEIHEVTGHTYNRPVESYLLDVNAAKFFVAKYDNAVGDAYLAHLIACEGKARTLDSLLADPANAARVFAELAAQRAAAAEAQRLAMYSQAALTTSQTNTAKQTRRVHELEAELRQLNRMVSISQWLVLRG